MDLFEKLENRPGPLGKFTSNGYGYYTFPKLEGPLGPVMKFNDKDVVVWSINDYLGIGNNEQVREIDTRVTQKYSLSAPMGARLMTGNSPSTKPSKMNWQILYTNLMPCSLITDIRV